MPSDLRLLLTPRYLAVLPFAVLAVALATGLPTDVLPNPWFSRMTPVRTLDIVLWPLTSLAVGALAATMVFGVRRAKTPGGTVAASGVAGTLAIGCPVCNKLVVAVLGVSGALSYFAPIQPVLGVGALAAALWVLRRRVRALEGACVVDSRAAAVGARPA